MPDWIKAIDPASIEAIATAIATIVVAVGAAIGRVRRAVAEATRKARGKVKQAARRGRGTGVVLVLVLPLLGGCSAAPAFGTALLGATVSAYCAGVSDAGKDVVRDTVTAGQKILACENEDD